MAEKNGCSLSAKCIYFALNQSFLKGNIISTKKLIIYISIGTENKHTFPQKFRTSYNPCKNPA